MIIVIPVENNNEDTEINKHLGRAPYFFIKDTEKGEVKFLENEAAKSSGGAGIKAAQIIIDLKADVLLTPKSGNKATDVLVDSNIRVYKTEGYNIKENLEMLEKDELEILIETNA